MHGLLFGEFMGTLVLILLGDGVVANVLLNKSKGQNSGWIVITTGWGFGVTLGICTALACGSPFAFINPAVALTVCILHPANWPIFLPVCLAELAGGLVGGILVYLAYLPHWKVTEDAGLKLGVFCTGPAIRNIPANALTEIIATTCLVVVGLTFANKGVGGATGLAAGWGPWLWGVLVWALGLSLGGPTGYAMNPARDLGPRLAHLILPIPGKRDSDWGYALVPVIGPFIGGAVAAGIILGSGI
jgi:glycerol uptake facilitator protein